MSVQIDFMVIVLALAAGMMGYLWVKRLFPGNRTTKPDIIEEVKKEYVAEKQKEIEDVAKEVATTSGGFGDWWASNKRKSGD